MRALAHPPSCMETTQQSLCRETRRRKRAVNRALLSRVQLFADFRVGINREKISREYSHGLADCVFPGFATMYFLPSARLFAGEFP